MYVRHFGSIVHIANRVIHLCLFDSDSEGGRERGGVRESIIAERLSSRQLILHQISQNVCMCVCPVTLQECN